MALVPERDDDDNMSDTEQPAREDEDDFRNTFDANNRDTVDLPPEPLVHIVSNRSLKHRQSFDMPERIVLREESPQRKEFRMSQLCPDSIIQTERDINSPKGDPIV